MEEYNAFFSGSMKSLTTSPYTYPGNIHDYKGKDIDPQNSQPTDAIYGMRYCMKGFMGTEKYDGTVIYYLDECHKKWFT